jgi:hypothetical protein
MQATNARQVRTMMAAGHTSHAEASSCIHTNVYLWLSAAPVCDIQAYRNVTCPKSTLSAKLKKAEGIRGLDGAKPQ